MGRSHVVGAEAAGQVGAGLRREGQNAVLVPGWCHVKAFSLLESGSIFFISFYFQSLRKLYLSDRLEEEWRVSREKKRFTQHMQGVAVIQIYRCHTDWFKSHINGY